MPEKRFYPWSFDENALELSLVPRPCEGEHADIRDYVDSEHYALNLVGVGGWSRISFKCTLCDPNNCLDAHVGDGDSVNDCLRLLVVCRSATTRRRLGVSLTSCGNGGWEGFFDLRREDWAGGLTVTPYAVWSTDTPNAVDPGTSLSGQILASGDSWAIYLDKKVVMPGGAIDGKWVSFSEHSNPQVSSRADCGWFLDLDDMESPKLLLNEDIEGFKNALNVTATHGYNASIRNMVSQAFMQQVLMELAMFSIDTLEGAALEESDGWRKDVLMSLAKRIKGESPEIIVNRWVGVTDREERIRVRDEVSVAVQRQISTWNQIRKAISTVGDFGDE